MSDSGSIRIGELEVRSHEHVVCVNGTEVSLSYREFDILMMLAEHPGWVLSASQLSGEPDAADYSPESVSVLISRLRHKLASAGAPDVIDTVRGFGYRLHSASVSDVDASHSSSASRDLRDASWQLQEAVIEVVHSGSEEQHRAASEVLEQARRDVFAILAE